MSKLGKKGLEAKISDEKLYFTLKELSEFTGFKESYIYKLTSQRKIPYYKPFGKKNFFKVAEIQEMFNSNRVSTMDELESDAVTYCLIQK
jgi:excisionase family DNA binding protein